MMPAMTNEIKRNRYIYLSLYIFSNFYFVFSYSLNGYLGGDFSQQFVADFSSLAISFIMILVCWLFFWGAFNLFERAKIIGLRRAKHSTLDWLFLAISIIHLYGLINGFISPSSDVERSVFYLVFNYIFSADMLLLIYLFYAVGKRSSIYYVNLLITIVIYLYSGRTGIFIYMLALVNLASYTRMGKVPVGLNVILIVVACLIFPFFRSLKHYMLLTVISDRYRNMSFVEGFISFWQGDFIEKYFKYFDETLERFQHVANVSFVFDRSEKISQFLAMYDYSLIYPTTKRIIENFFGVPTVDYQLYKLFGAFVTQGASFNWNMPLGVPGLFLVDWSLGFYYVIVSLFLVVFSIIISKAIDRNGFIIELTFLSMLLFILHGWINDFIVYVSSLTVFLILLLLINSSAAKNISGGSDKQFINNELSGSNSL